MSDLLLKIAFDVSGQNDLGIAVERLWAKFVREGVYIVDNSPFYAYEISCGDTVAATDVDGFLTFTGVVERGGHSTYRVKLPSDCDHDHFLAHWPPLAALGCTYEGTGGARRLYSIDVPEQSRVGAVFEILQTAEASEIWEFEEAHYFGPLRTDPPLSIA
jgi:hypothetical protein